VDYIGGAVPRIEQAEAVVFITQIRDKNSVLVDGLLTEIRKRAPQLPIIIAVVPEDPYDHDFERLSKLSLSGVCFTNDREVEAELRRLAAELPFHVRRRTLADTIIEGIGQPAASILRTAFEIGHAPCSVPEFGVRVGKTVDVLAGILRTTAQMKARELLAWGRLGAFCVEAESTLLSNERISNGLAFSSPGALCNLSQRLVRHSPTELRRQGSTFLAKSFLARASSP